MYPQWMIERQKTGRVEAVGSKQKAAGSSSR